MRDRDAVDEERKRAGALVRAVAHDTRFSSRKQELTTLAAAVSTGGSAEAVWQGINLQDAFHPDSTITPTPRRRRRLASWLGPLAAIVVLLPIAWTWWSFRKAVEVYQQVLGSAEMAGATLLPLWTTGFGGLLPERYWLPEVAQASATLIFLGIVLMVGAWLVSRSADAAEKDEFQQCSTQLAQALNCASITINASNIQDPVQGLSGASRELLRAHQETRQSIRLLHDAAKQLEDTAARMTAGLDGIATGAAHMASGTAAVGQSLGHHTSALQHQISELTQIRASLERLSGLQVRESTGKSTY